MKSQYIMEKGCLVVYVPRELDHHQANRIRTETDLLIDTYHVRHLVFDFTETEFMDSSGIALILRSQQRMQLLEGSVVLRNIPAQARRVLDAAGIGRLVSIK